MEPWLSWVLALAVGAGLFFYYRGTDKPKVVRQPLETAQQTSTRKRQDRQQVESSAAVSSTLENASMKKRKQVKQTLQDKVVPAVVPASVAAGRSAPIDETDAADDKEWAKQLSAAQKGVTISSAAKPSAAKPKASKKKNQTKESSDSSAWPSESDSAAAAPIHEPSSRDVSDMLEPTAPGPSVLRLTGEETPKKQLPKKPEQEKETKKQRQNRQKAEERKAAREQDEKERKVLMENQRRTAREARGEPAKNGVPAAAPVSSAWSKSTTNENSASTGQLLDTFDHEAASATSSNEPHTNGTTPATASSTLDAYEQSEEAQMKMISQLTEDSGWSEVTKSKKSKKKTSAPASPPVEPGVKDLNHYSSAATDELVHGETSAPGLPVKATTPSNSYDVLSYTPDFAPGTGPRHPQDSDWAAE